jgi:cysteinyl-tRNA synthetase
MTKFILVICGNMTIFYFFIFRHVALDILRRIIQEYLGYDIICCTNMNDINDEVYLFH